MGGGKEEKVVTTNTPWAEQVPYLIGPQIAPVISQPTPINADWLWWANQVAQTGMPISQVPAMSMQNPMLTGENVYGGQPNIFGESFHTTPTSALAFPTYTASIPVPVVLGGGQQQLTQGAIQPGTMAEPANWFAGAGE